MALLRKCLLLYGYVLQVHLSTGRDMEWKKERTHRVVTFHNSIPTSIRPYTLLDVLERSYRSSTLCKGMLRCMTLRLSGLTLLLLVLVLVHPRWTHFSTTIWFGMFLVHMKHRQTSTNGSSTSSSNAYLKVQIQQSPSPIPTSCLPEWVKEMASRKHGSSSSNKQCEIGNKD